MLIGSLEREGDRLLTIPPIYIMKGSMMKTEVLEKLADLLDTVKDRHWVDEEKEISAGFSMKDYFHSKNDCETPSCIAGHLISMENKSQERFHKLGTLKLAAYLADIDHETATDLFLPGDEVYEIKKPWDVTAKEAAKVVRNLVKTGKVDWTIVCGNMVEES